MNSEKAYITMDRIESLREYAHRANGVSDVSDEQAAEQAEQADVSAEQAERAAERADTQDKIDLAIAKREALYLKDRRIEQWAAGIPVAHKGATAWRCDPNKRRIDPTRIPNTIHEISARARAGLAADPGVRIAITVVVMPPVARAVVEKQVGAWIARPRHFAVDVSVLADSAAPDMLVVSGHEYGQFLYVSGGVCSNNISGTLGLVAERCWRQRIDRVASMISRLRRPALF